MTPKLEETQSYDLPQKAYDNKGYLNNEKPALEISNDLKNQLQSQPVMDFDDLLPHIGEFGRYQKILFFLMIPFAFFIAFVYFSQIFMTLVPEEHWCYVPELQDLPMDQRRELAIPKNADGTFDKCSMYSVNFTKFLLTGGLSTGLKEDWAVVPCKNGWEYNYKEVPYITAASEFDWVCDNSHLATVAQSIFFVGAIVGGLLFGYIADHYGRIPALVGCNIIGFIFGVLTAFCTGFWSFSVCRFFYGFAFDNCFTMMYILVLEYTGAKWRTFVANMSIAIFFTIATSLLPWIALWIADWKTFAIATSAPLLLALATPFIVPESARWLVSQGHVEKALGILKKFAKVNGRTVSPEVYKNFSDSCARMQEEEAENASYSILDLFRTPRLRRTTILLIVIWMSISLVFDGHVRNVGSLGLDFFITFTIASATEFPADTVLTLTLDRWGRRWLAFGTLAMSGILSLLSTAVPLGALSATLAILGRFCVNISYNIGLQYCAEVLPTVVRAQGVAFIHIMGYVASIISPFIVYTSHISLQLPLILLGILSIFAGCLSLLLPETLNHELPQTLADGEEFGTGQSMFDFPCCAKTIEDDKDEEIGKFKRSISISGQASLRASTRGEYSSSILQRSVKSRSSFKSINTKL